ncbi:MAG: dTMP kinase [Sulfuritalea sp.]|jgi:dTMP kinase|nr:dTMP kinase [Sulfuritalea sp.]MBK9348879.1 dTMP kinase [Sulfuritalea sp.]
MSRGRFISFEGIDGAGKSTQHKWLVEHLKSQGRQVVATREPGGTPLGEKLRALLLAEPMHLETEALLMFAARREHLAAVIEPALARGDWVVCDRFVDASFAYQGGGRGLDWGKLETLADWVLGSLRPDLTLIFDAPVAVAQERLHAATDKPDRFEQEHAEFFERVRGAYLRIAHAETRRVRLIDATKHPDEINKELEKIIATI